MKIPNTDLSLWYKVVNIPDYHVFYGKVIRNAADEEKQFLTRVLYTGATPFKTTLHTDSTVFFFCDSDAPKEILKEMKNSDVDFSISSRILGPFVPSGWAILYNWNSRTKLLLRDWVFEMLRVGITHEDDQGRLHLALHRSVLQNRIKARRLSSNWAFTPKCYRGNETYESYPCNIRVSVPVNSKIRITHSKDNKYCLTNGDDNNMINITRIHVQVNGKRYIVTSQDEFEEIIMPYKLPMIDWNMKNKSSNYLFWEECGNEEPFYGFS